MTTTTTIEMNTTMDMKTTTARKQMKTTAKKETKTRKTTSEPEVVAATTVVVTILRSRSRTTTRTPTRAAGTCTSVEPTVCRGVVARNNAASSCKRAHKPVAIVMLVVVVMVALHRRAQSQPSGRAVFSNLGPYIYCDSRYIIIMAVNL